MVLVRIPAATSPARRRPGGNSPPTTATNQSPGSAAGSSGSTRLKDGYLRILGPRLAHDPRPTAYC